MMLAHRRRGVLWGHVPTGDPEWHMVKGKGGGGSCTTGCSLKWYMMGHLECIVSGWPGDGVMYHRVFPKWYMRGDVPGGVAPSRSPKSDIYLVSRKAQGWSSGFSADSLSSALYTAMSLRKLYISLLQFSMSSLLALVVDK